jgi:serine protease AprX
MLPTTRKLSRINHVLLLALVGIAIFASAGLAATARTARVQDAVWAYRDAHAGEPVPVIIQTTGSMYPAAVARAAGAEVRSQLGLIHAVAADVPADRLEALSSDPNVHWVSLDAPIVSTDSPDQSGTPSSVYPQEIAADTQWQAGNSGQGIGVAIVDTGIVQSDDFGKRVVSAVSRDNTSGDGYGHGSHVAGLAAGNGANSNGKYVGVARRVNLINVKVGDNTGAASVSDVINGLQYVIDHKDAYNIRVVNLSLRSNTAQSYTTDPLDAAVELVTFRGILVVVAAGNTGTASDAVSFAPANDPFVLTVGAVDDMGTGDYRDDAIPSWSSRGITQDGFAKPDVYAPGRHLISVLSKGSVLATQYPANIIGDSYFQLSGTSMAAGVASGAAALVFNARPEWTPGQAKAALMKGAASLPGTPTASVAQVDRTVSLKSVIDPTPNTKPNFLLLSAAGITNPESISWGSVSWGSISWGSISWGSISWGSVSWGSVSWGATPTQ